jgi:hypothetical protein
VEELDTLRLEASQAGGDIARLSEEEKEILSELDRQIRANIETNRKSFSVDVPKA